jgi:selenophosphate synthase
MSEENIRLTQFSEGSGCGCKIAPAVLDRFYPPVILFNRLMIDYW